MTIRPSSRLRNPSNRRLRLVEGMTPGRGRPAIGRGDDGADRTLACAMEGASIRNQPPSSVRLTHRATSVWRFRAARRSSTTNIIVRFRRGGFLTLTAGMSLRGWQALSGTKAPATRPPLMPRSRRRARPRFDYLTDVLDRRFLRCRGKLEVKPLWDTRERLTRLERSTGPASGCELKANAGPSSVVTTRYVTR